jgi:hypothetical protein
VQWLELASQGYPQLQQYIEKAKIPEITRLYKLSTTNKDQIFDLIKWKYFSSNQGDVRILFDELKDFEYQAKIEAPHFLQLSQLISSYVQPIYVYFMNDVGFVLNTSDSTITTDLLLLFGPILLKQIAKRRFSASEMSLSRQVRQLWANFVIFGYELINMIILLIIPLFKGIPHQTTRSNRGVNIVLEIFILKILVLPPHVLMRKIRKESRGFCFGTSCYQKFQILEIICPTIYQKNCKIVQVMYFRCVTNRYHQKF